MTSFQDKLCDVIVGLERLSLYGYLSIRYKSQLFENTTDVMSR